VLTGDPLTLAATVANDGNIFGGPFKATWFISPNPTPTPSDAVLHQWDLDGIAPSKTSSHSGTVSAPSLPGTYYVALMTDSQSQVEEANEGDNWGTVFTLTVEDRDTDGDGVPDRLDPFPFNPIGATDSDDDGIADEWEMHWFGNLTTADATSDYDLDGATDLQEFLAWNLGGDPTQATSSLPVDGAACLAILSAALAGAFVFSACRVRRR
jgi:hypothetical protein